jgi:hypothetical protein
VLLHSAGCVVTFNWLYCYSQLVVLLRSTGCVVTFNWLYCYVQLVVLLHSTGCVVTFNWLCCYIQLVVLLHSTGLHVKCKNMGELCSVPSTGFNCCLQSLHSDILAGAHNKKLTRNLSKKINLHFEGLAAPSTVKHLPTSRSIVIRLPSGS